MFLDTLYETILSQRYTERASSSLGRRSARAVAIETERQASASLREQADLVIDTSRLAPADLKRILMGHNSGGPRQTPLTDLS